MTATSIYDIGTSPQCLADCWWCLGIDTSEFEKYKISIDADPKCVQRGNWRTYLPDDPRIAEKRKLVEMNQTMFTSICGVEGHLDLDVLNEWMDVDSNLHEWTQKCKRKQ